MINICSGERCMTRDQKNWRSEGKRVCVMLYQIFLRDERLPTLLIKIRNPGFNLSLNCNLPSKYMFNAISLSLSLHTHSTPKPSMRRSINFNNMSIRLGFLYAKMLGNFLHCTFMVQFFLNNLFFCTQLYDINYSYLIQIVFGQSYGFKYSYLIQTMIWF